MASPSQSHPNLAIHGSKFEPKGRYLVSTRHFRPGDRISLFDSPLLALPTQSRYTVTCHGCLQPKDVLRPCAGCRGAWYCSKECQRLGWHAGHKAECKAIKPVSEQGRTLPTPTRALLSVVLSEAKWKEVNEKLSGNEERFRARTSEWTDLELQAMMVRKLAGEPPWVTNGEGGEGGDVLQKYASVICKLSTNAFNVHDPDLDTDSIFVDTTLAMANHSCMPNASAQIFGSKGVLIAERPIQKDDEITISYKVPDLSHPTAHRKKALANYHFDCTCPRCKDDLTVYQVCRASPNLEGNAFSVVHNVDILRSPPIDEASVAGGTKLYAQMHEDFVRLEGRSSSSPTSRDTYGPDKPMELLRQEYTIFKPFIEKGMWANCGLFLQDCLSYYTQREAPVERLLIVCLFAMRVHPYIHPNPFNPMRLKSAMSIVTCLPGATMDQADYKKRLTDIAMQTGVVGGQALEDLKQIDAVAAGRMLTFMILEYAPKAHVHDYPFWAQVREGHRALRSRDLWPDEGTRALIEMWERREPNEDMFLLAWKRLTGQLDLFSEMGAKLIPLVFGP